MTALAAGRHFSSLPAVILIGGVFLGVIGPFGHVERFELFARVGLWITYMAVGMPLLLTVHLALSPRLARTGIKSAVTLVAFSAAAASVPMLVVVELIGVAEGRPLPESPAAALRELAEIFCVGAPALGVLHFLLHRNGGSGHHPVNLRQSGSPGESRWELPSELRRAVGDQLGPVIHALRAEGHYTRVYGNLGDRLVSLSMAEAVDLMAGCDGAQIHRSWWVARSSVLRLMKTNRGLELVLTNGVRAPVARRRRKDLRAKGWPL